MAKPIPVPDVPTPDGYYWQQEPHVQGQRCHLTAGHEGPHSWEGRVHIGVDPASQETIDAAVGFALRQSPTPDRCVDAATYGTGLTRRVYICTRPLDHPGPHECVCPESITSSAITYARWED